MEILLEFDLLVLQQGDTQAAGGNIQQHDALFAGDVLVPDGFTDGHILCINFHGHFRDSHVQSGPQFDLVQHEHFVAGFPHSCGGLRRIHVRAVLLHQFLKSLQHLADFFYHGERNAFVFEGFFPQADGVFALLDDLDAAEAAIFYNSQAQHLRPQMDRRQCGISFPFHKNSPYLL